jgi:hypothetical protein
VPRAYKYVKYVRYRCAQASLLAFWQQETDADIFEAIEKSVG